MTKPARLLWLLLTVLLVWIELRVLWGVLWPANGARPGEPSWGGR